MTYKDKKLAVLELIRQKKTPLSAAEILQELGFSDRSVRRWLFQLIEEGLIERIGQKKNTSYRTIVQDKIFSPKSTQAIQYVREPIYKRPPVTYNLTWLEKYQPNNTVYISKEIKIELHEAGKRNEGDEPAGTYARHIFNRLLIDLSYNSSRLEGNTYSLLDTKRLLLEGEDPEGKLDEEKVMILNHKEAIRYLVDNASKITVSPHEVCTMHYLLSDGLVPTKYAGKIRDHWVRIGGSNYIPYENTDILETQLNLICEKANLINDPFEKAIFLLAHISYLQAFTDVNKRTARLCSNIPLVSNNFVPLSFNDIERDDYRSALIAIYELNDINPLVDLFVYSYLRTCELYNTTVEALGFDKIRVQYRAVRRGILRHIIESELTEKAMQDYIGNEVKRLVEKSDQQSFLQDVQEDLKEINPQRIVGLGISADQLNNWLKKGNL